MKWFGRRSVRARLTALFVLASAIVVVALSVALLVNESRQSNRRLDRDLVRRIDRAELQLRRSGRLPYTETYGWVIDSDYRVIAYSDAITLPGLLTTSQVDFVFRSGNLQLSRQDPAFEGASRILAQRRVIDDRALVIAVGSSEEVLRDARRQLVFALSVGAPLLVLLVGSFGWSLAGAILRPVRRMTDDAAKISQFGTTAKLDVGSGNDELTHLGTTLNSMLGRLEDSYRRERTFVDDASHELRTPLAIVRGELELALMNPANPTATNQALSNGIEEVDRLIALANDLLVSARIRSEQIVFSNATCSPANVIADLLKRRSANERPSIREDIRIDPAVLIPMRADHFERVLSNLIDNALRFAEQRVLLSVEQVDHDHPNVRCIVRDDGPGFAPEFLERAFERFSVGNTSRTRPVERAGSDRLDDGRPPERASSGTGLGLAIVAELVHNAGGQVEAANRVDRAGAAVTVILPLTSG